MPNLLRALAPRRNTLAVRAHRQRARNGKRDDEELLRDMKLLADWDSDGRKAVGRAIEKLLETTGRKTNWHYPSSVLMLKSTATDIRLIATAI